MPRQTYFAKTGELDKTWHHLDAQGKILGRIATEVATILMGKHRPEYTPHVDSGDCVVITNAEQIAEVAELVDKQTDGYGLVGLVNNAGIAARVEAPRAGDGRPDG